MRLAIKALKVLGVILLIYAMIWAEVFSRSKEQFRKAEQAYSQGDLEMAYIQYARSLRMYGPGIPYNSKAIQKLQEIAQQYEAAKDPENALNVYEELAAAIRVIRSFYYPYYSVEMMAREKIKILEPTVIQIQEERRKREEAEWRASQAQAQATPSPQNAPTPAPTPAPQ